MTNPVEASAAVNAAQGTGKPVLLAYRLEKNGRLKSGQTLAEAGTTSIIRNSTES